jgi:hypothetical protein
VLFIQYATDAKLVGAGLLAMWPAQTPQNLQTKKNPASLDAGFFSFNA